MDYHDGSILFFLVDLSFICWDIMFKGSFKLSSGIK